MRNTMTDIIIMSFSYSRRQFSESTDMKILSSVHPEEAKIKIHQFIFWFYSYIIQLY